MEIMSQMSYHKVMGQIEFYIENVKCLIKYKTKGYSVEYKTSCFINDSPAWLANNTSKKKKKKNTSRKRVHAVSPKFTPPSGSLQIWTWVSWVMSQQGHEDMGVKPLILPHRLTDCKWRFRGLLAPLVPHMEFTQWSEGIWHITTIKLSSTNNQDRKQYILRY